MQQRRYRPGDVLDDYCPRERRITNHAVVAMIDDHIKQTRCVVCDAEHEFKDGKAPPPRRRQKTSALFGQVLDGLQGPAAPARQVASLDTVHDDDGDQPVVDPLSPIAPVDTPEPARSHPVAAGANDDRPWRRQLIRASFPRPDGHQTQPTRQIPEFTSRLAEARSARNGRHRDDGGRGYGAGPMRSGRDEHAQPGQRSGSGRRRRRGKR